MFKVEATPTRDTLPSGLATTVLTKDGGLIKEEFHSQDIHSETVSDSKSRQE